MKNFFLLALAAALVAFSIEAVGAPVYKANLTLADGGRNAQPVNPQGNYLMQCPIPVVYRLSNDGGLAAVGLDPYAQGRLISANASLGLYTYEATFQTATSTFVNATAVDGGQTQCLLFQDTLNLPR
jgi:hypothetical protein